MRIDPCDLIRSDVRLATLPSTFTRLTERINNPRSSLGDISGIISEDQALSARLLRLANSAYFGMPRKVDTITNALTVIGTQQLQDIVLATSVMGMFTGIPASLISMQEFWRHSLGCGVAGRILATFRREANIERFFVSGILHDLGRLIICLKLPDQFRRVIELCRTENIMLYEAEQELLGFDHAGLGGLLLEEWKLPTILVDGALFHHNPKRSMRFYEETCIAHVSDMIAHAMELGSSGEKSVPPQRDQAWKNIGLPLSILCHVVTQTHRQFEAAVEIICPAACHE